MAIRGGHVAVLLPSEGDDGETAAATGDAGRFGDGARRIVDVAEDVEEERLIERSAIERELGGIPEGAGDVLRLAEALFGGGDHLFAAIDAGDALRARRDELGHG